MTAYEQVVPTGRLSFPIVERPLRRYPPAVVLVTRQYVTFVELGERAGPLAAAPVSPGDCHQPCEAHGSSLGYCLINGCQR